MKTIKTFVGLAATLLLSVSCASEDTAQNNNQKKETDTYAVFVAGKEDTGTEQSKTRTSLDYNTGNFFWEQGDNIFVKDDGGIWRTGTSAVNKNTTDFFKFQLPGNFTGTSYTVFYPGKNGTNDQVTIDNAQAQDTPNSTKHLGVAGDCGLATANKMRNIFPFWIDHKTAYLVFQPYNSNAALTSCYVQRIEVTSNNNIAGNYTLDPVTKKLTGTGSSKIVTISLGGSGDYTNGFPLTTSADRTKNGAYMVIAPGVHELTVRYWIVDPATGAGGSITKKLPSFNYEENNYYDMTANLNLNNYAHPRFYMWDAQQNYWWNHEFDSADPKQPTEPNTANTTDCPQSQTADPLRWHNTVNDGGMTQASHSAASLLNVNEMVWYIKHKGFMGKRDTLWTTMGHLYQGGLWFMKRAKFMDKYHVTATEMQSGYDSYDWRNHAFGLDDFKGGNKILYENKNPDNKDDYFFVPRMPYYYNGKLIVQSYGYIIPSSSPFMNTDDRVWLMMISGGPEDRLYIMTLYRGLAYYVQPFE